MQGAGRSAEQRRQFKLSSAPAQAKRALGPHYALVPLHVDHSLHDRLAVWVGPVTCALEEVDISALPEREPRNLFEHLVEEAQRTQREERLLLAFAGALLGARRTSSGDRYCPRFLEGLPAEVWLWHQDERYTFSWAASTFSQLDRMLWAAAVLGGSSVDNLLAKLDLRVLQQTPSLAERIQLVPSEHHERVELVLELWDKIGFELEPPMDYDLDPLRELLEAFRHGLDVQTPSRVRLPAPDPFARAAWPVSLLLGEAVTPPLELRARESFRGALRRGRLQDSVSDALYYLWWSWFAGTDQEVLASLTQVRDHPVRLVRDAGAIVEQLVDGRSTLGNLDVASLREQLRDTPRVPVHALQTLLLA